MLPSNMTHLSVLPLSDFQKIAIVELYICYDMCAYCEEARASLECLTVNTALRVRLRYTRYCISYHKGDRSTGHLWEFYSGSIR
jgi:hypothetical protein